MIGKNLGALGVSQNSNSISSQNGSVTSTELTYEELQVLVEDNGLIPGSIYIINDYQTKYFVEGTNSSGIIEEKTVTSNISGWGVLNNNYEYDLKVGDNVVISYLPESYSGALTVGQTVNCTATNSSYYFKFSGNLHSIIGAKFNIFRTRYNSIAKDVEIWDDHGNTIMRAGGLLNTQIHNGLPYGQMSAEENTTPPMERLILTASSTNEFEEIGYSGTFNGDVIKYNFKDREVKNDNNQVIGVRNGYVYYRKNVELSIECELDWRAFKFRRWLIDPESRNMFLNLNEDVSTRVGFDGKYLFTSENRSDASINPFYIGLTPEPNLANINANGLYKTFNALAETPTHCKDFTLFKLDADYNPVNVKSFKCGNPFGTVFMGLSGELNYELEINAEHFTKNTFVSNVQILGDKLSFFNCTFLDAASIKGFNSTFDKVQALSFMASDNVLNSRFEKVIMGTQKGSIFTGSPNPQPASKWIIMRYIDNSIVTQTVLGQAFVNFCMDGSYLFNSSIYLHYSPAWGDGKVRERVYIRGSVFSNVSMIVPKHLDQVGFNNLYFGRTNTNSTDGLFKYDFNVGHLKKLEIFKNNSNDALYNINIDENNQTEIKTLATPKNT